MFEKVVIVGIGLLGGSLARDIKRHSLASSIVGVSRSPETAANALELGVVDSVEPLTSAVNGADLVVIATPMQAMPAVLRDAEPHLSSRAVLTDVGSVKGDLYARLKAEFPQLLAQFVLAHPIAGGENSGVLASRESLFVDKNVIVTPTSEVARSRVEKVHQLWQAVGAYTLEMSLAQHDAIFARTSHLPHVVAFALVNYLNAQPERERLFDMAAAGFYDFTRIASSDAEMWRDICVTNTAEIVDALDGFIEQVTDIKQTINSLEQSEILNYFNAAKIARDAGLDRKKR